jgi:hypothetical protein
MFGHELITWRTVSRPSDLESVLHGFGEELRWCLQVVGAEQNSVLDAHGLAALIIVL